MRGEGSHVWDAEGNRYLDFFPGWGCNLVGHCPPRVVEAVREQVGQLIHVPNTWYMEAQGQFAQMLSRKLDRCLGGILPGFRAGADHFDDFVDALRHGGLLGTELGGDSSYAKYDSLSGA